MRKTLIITEKQLDEICGGNGAYLDNLAIKPDVGGDFANKVTTGGENKEGYSKPLTGDDFVKDVGAANNWRLYTRSTLNRGPMAGTMSPAVCEMTKREWEEKILEAHGNKRLNDRTFDGQSYGAATVAKCRMNKAIKKTASLDPETRKEGLRTLSKMKTNGVKNLEAAQGLDKIIQDNKPEGEKITSAPKTYGNNGAHSKKTPGVFLNEHKKNKIK